MTGLRGDPLHWDGRGRVTPAPTEFRPRKRVLELSCGVCSLQQVPWWDADRRAPLRASPASEGGSEGGSRARWRGGLDYAPAGVPLPFCLTGMIEPKAGPTAGLGMT